ncbi:MAG: hypothetical protein J6L73_02895 [Muribaculaceae bacterium]|nr:hypothetical protein [Muribaculaceae bacterium]
MKNLISILWMFLLKGLAISAFAVSLLAFGGCSSDDDEPVKTDPDVSNTEQSAETAAKEVFDTKVANKMWVRTDDDWTILSDGSQHDTPLRCGMPGGSAHHSNAIVFGKDKCTRYFVHQSHIGSQIGTPYGQFDYDYEYDAAESAIYMVNPRSGEKELWYVVQPVDDNNIMLLLDFGCWYYDETIGKEIQDDKNYRKIRYRLANDEDIAKYSSWQKSEYDY